MEISRGFIFANFRKLEISRLFSLKSLWFQRFDIFCAIVKNDFIKRTPFLMKRFKKTCNRQYFRFIFANRRFLYISRGFIFANCRFLKILRGFIFANFGHSRKFIPANIYPRETLSPRIFIPLRYCKCGPNIAHFEKSGNWKQFGGSPAPPRKWKICIKIWIF